jgi:hypothetical protein
MPRESPDRMVRVRFVGYVVHAQGEFYRGKGGRRRYYSAVELVESSKKAGSLVALSVEICVDDVELKTTMLASYVLLANQEKE